MLCDRSTVMESLHTWENFQKKKLLRSLNTSELHMIDKPYKRILLHFQLFFIIPRFPTSYSIRIIIMHD